MGMEPIAELDDVLQLSTADASSFADEYCISPIVIAIWGSSKNLEARINIYKHWLNMVVNRATGDVRRF